MTKEIVENLINKLIDEGKLPFGKDDFFFEESKNNYFLEVNGIDPGVDINSDGNVIFDRCTPDERIVSEENLEQELINQLEHLTSEYQENWESDLNDNNYKFGLNIEIPFNSSEEIKKLYEQKIRLLWENVKEFKNNLPKDSGIFIFNTVTIPEEDGDYELTELE